MSRLRAYIRAVKRLVSLVGLADAAALNAVNRRELLEIPASEKLCISRTGMTRGTETPARKMGLPRAN